MLSILQSKSKSESKCIHAVRGIAKGQSPLQSKEKVASKPKKPSKPVIVAHGRCGGS